jgi:hypothetical protein
LIAAMSNTLATDRFELQDLMLNYAAGVDERDIERYRACFAKDVEVINFGTHTYRSSEEWVSYVWSVLDKYSATQHMMGPQFATIDGDTATTRIDVQAVHFVAGIEERFTLWATYDTIMQRINGRWLISRHELTVRGASTD